MTELITPPTGGSATHEADTVDAHDASAISFDDTGLGITAADVQEMGEQLDAAISAGGIPATIFDAAGDLIVASAADTAVRLPMGTALQNLRVNAGATALEYATPGGSSPLTLVHLTADETGKTDANLVNTGLSFAVVSGVYYSFRFYCVYTTTVGTVGLKVALTTPTFTIFSASATIFARSGDAAGTSAWIGVMTSSADPVVSDQVGATGNNYLALVQGVILPSANGTLMLQYAAETTGATVTLKQASAAELVTHA